MPDRLSDKFLFRCKRIRRKKIIWIKKNRIEKKIKRKKTSFSLLFFD